LVDFSLWNRAVATHVALLPTHSLPGEATRVREEYASRGCDSHAGRSGIRGRVMQPDSLTPVEMACWARNLPEHVREYWYLHSWPWADGCASRKARTVGMGAAVLPIYNRALADP
jgi:hypothetical protein